MENLVLPKLMKNAFAYDGSKNPIPETIVDLRANFASYEQGFPDITSVPIEAGGLPPQRKDINGIFNETTAILAYFCQGGTIPFNAEFCEKIGGYPLNAVLSTNDGSIQYRSLVANNTVDFNTEEDVSEFWEKIGGGGGGGGSADVGVYNSKDILTVSGQYTAPVTGWYKITCIGGGGGGQSSYLNSGSRYSGGGGGSGGTSIGYKYMLENDTVSFVIGAGGSGGVGNKGAGENGGNTIFDNIVGGGGGGGGGANATSRLGGVGGTSTSNMQGFVGGTGDYVNATGIGVKGAGGGGHGGGIGKDEKGDDAVQNTGGGGGGGGAYSSSFGGGNGGSGVIFVEYYNPNKPTE